jgi:hypothetical protein
VILSICCNDERGHFTGFAEAVQLQDGMLDLVSQHLRGARFARSGEGIRLSRRRFPVRASTDWYGNVFWNGYDVPAREVVKLLVYLKESRKWECEGGWVELCEWWERDTGYNEAEWLLAQFKGKQAVAQDGELRGATSSVSPREVSERAPSAEPKTNDPITPDLLR